MKYIPLVTKNPNHADSTSCQVFTALFDLEREHIDSRSMPEYLEMLDKTISLFPGVVVFHDGVCDNFHNRLATFVKVAPTSLYTFKYLPELKEVLRTFKPGSPNDITFKLPAYGLMKFAKFELQNRVINDYDCESVLWVDAGLSRFLHSGTAIASLDSYSEVKRGIVDAAFEIDLRRNLDIRKFRIKNPDIGSCKKVIGGGSFWLNSAAVPKFAKKIDDSIKGLLKDRVWDNEQVLLRKIIPSLGVRVHFITQGRSQPGSVARNFLNNYKFRTSIISNLIMFLLRS